MILCDRSDIDTFMQSGAWGEITLDLLLRRAAEKHPEKPALLAFSGASWTSLTYGELDARVDRLARLLMASGLRQDDVVAFQLPNGFEAYVTLLGVFRAQGIACPLPLTWRESEISNALGQVNARFVITTANYAGHAYSDMMRFVAAEIFSVRRLLAHGEALPDGVESIGELLAGVPDMDLPSPRRDAANHVATICFDSAQGAPRPVARSHNEWLVAARLPLSALRMNADSRMLSGHFPTGLAAIASAVGPWLLAGSTLAVYDALDFPLSDKAVTDSGADIMLLPYSAASALAAAGQLASTSCTIAVVWHAGALLQQKAPLEMLGAQTVDIICFGETAIVARRRKHGETAAELRIGELRPTEAGLESAALLELKIEGASEGELMLGGAMLPSAILGVQEQPLPRVGRLGRTFMSTGLTCRLTGGGAGRAKVIAASPTVLHVANNVIAADELDKHLREHSGVSDAAAYSAPHGILGTSIRAAVTVEPDRKVSIEDLRTYLGIKRLGVHKLPDAITLVDTIPRDGNHRVMRDRLSRAS